MGDFIAVMWASATSLTSQQPMHIFGTAGISRWRKRRWNWKIRHQLIITALFYNRHQAVSFLSLWRKHATSSCCLEEIQKIWALLGRNQKTTKGQKALNLRLLSATQYHERTDGPSVDVSVRLWDSNVHTAYLYLCTVVEPHARCNISTVYQTISCVLFLPEFSISSGKSTPRMKTNCHTLTH